MASSMFGGIHPASRKENTRRKPLLPPGAAAQPGGPAPWHEFGGPSLRLPLVNAGRPGAGGAARRPSGGRGRGVSAPRQRLRHGWPPCGTRPRPWGGRAPAVVVRQRRARYAPARVGRSPSSPAGVAPPGPELLDRVEAARASPDMGGGCLPRRRRSSAGPAGRVDTLIVNAAECEPYVTADHAPAARSAASPILQGDPRACPGAGCPPGGAGRPRAGHAHRRGGAGAPSSRKRQPGGAEDHPHPLPHGGGEPDRPDGHPPGGPAG